MKKMNYFMMSMLATAALTMSSCSSDNDVTNGGNQLEVVDGVYMTLKVAGPSADSNTSAKTRTDGPETDNGTPEESAITNGTLYIYDGSNCIFKRVLTEADWASAPTETTAGQTNPIKISVNTVTTNHTYYVYFMANKNDVENPLATDAKFIASTTGGSEYANDNRFVMFNENDGKISANHSTVMFEEGNQSASNPATAKEIKLDRVVARIDAPEVKTDLIQPTTTTATTNIAANIESINYDAYAVSNMNNNSYIIQNWENNFADLVVDNSSLYQAYNTFGNLYTANGLTQFTTEAKTPKTYVFENTTTNTNEATALYFSIKANLKTDAQVNADFSDGTFYRYDNKIYTRIADIYTDAENGIVANPFNENGTTPAAADVVASLKKTDGTLIDEGITLAEFREKFHIQVYRAGIMYYRWAITDNTYKSNTAYSVLRNSIYHLNVTKIAEIGKDVPNGPDNVDPNYYMTVEIQVNPWILNSQDITLQ